MSITAHNGEISFGTCLTIIVAFYLVLCQQGTCILYTKYDTSASKTFGRRINNHDNGPPFLKALLYACVL